MKDFVTQRDVVALSLPTGLDPERPACVVAVDFVPLAIHNTNPVALLDVMARRGLYLDGLTVRDDLTVEVQLTDLFGLAVYELR